jgi:hypothetical protein
MKWFELIGQKTWCYLAGGIGRVFDSGCETCVSLFCGAFIVCTWDTIKGSGSPAVRPHHTLVNK